MITIINLLRNMKEKLISLNSDSDSNLNSEETSELENLDVFSSELGENDSLKSFNEEEFYKEKTSFLSKLFFWWTSPIFALSKSKNININTLKKTKKIHIILQLIVEIYSPLIIV